MKKFKNILIYSLLLNLIACSNKEPPLQGKRISILDDNINTEQLTKESIILEKPYINKKWTSQNGNEINNIGHIGGKKKYKKIFSKSIGTISKTKLILYKPVANENTIFTIDGNLQITATNPKDKKFDWINTDLQNNSETSIKFGSLVLNDDYLYAINNTGKIIKIDIKTGKSIYNNDTNKKIKSGLQYCNNNLIFITEDNELNIINEANGKIISSHKSIEESSSFIKGSTPSCNKEFLISAFSNSEIHIMNNKNSSKNTFESLYNLSKNKINNLTDIIASPIIHNNYSVLKGFDTLKIIDLDKKTTLWQKEHGGITTPIISNNTIFNIDNRNNIYAYNITNGNIIWQNKINVEDNITIFDPLLVNNEILVTSSNGDLIRFNAYNGNIISNTNITSKIDTDPIIVNGKLIILSNATLEIFF